MFFVSYGRQFRLKAHQIKKNVAPLGNGTTVYTVTYVGHLFRVGKATIMTNGLFKKIFEFFFYRENLRSERCILVKYLYPVIYWRLFKVKIRVGVRVGDRSYNIRGITIVVSYWNC